MTTTYIINGETHPMPGSPVLQLGWQLRTGGRLFRVDTITFIGETGNLEVELVEIAEGLDA